MAENQAQISASVRKELQQVIANWAFEQGISRAKLISAMLEVALGHDVEVQDKLNEIREAEREES
jgi:hypothetical protein